MPRGILEAYPDTIVRLLLKVPGATDVLGQTAPDSWVAGGDMSANVQPLGAEVAEKMGLVADRELYRVQLPASQTLNVGGRLRMKGRDWKAVRVEPWSSYFLAIVEGV